MLLRDQGLQVQGATVERGALYPAVHCVDRVDWVEEKIVLHRGMKKAPEFGAW